MQAGIAISYLKSATVFGHTLDLQRSKHYSVLVPHARHEMCLFKQYSLARQPNGGRPPKLVHAPCRTLFYFNAPPRMTDGALRDLLVSVKCPLPLAITVINNNESESSSRGGGRPSCGFLDYPDVSAATGVIMQMNNTEYNGFTFRVAYASKERMQQSAVVAALAARAASGGAEADHNLSGGHADDAAAHAGQKRRRSPSYGARLERSLDGDTGTSGGEVLLSEQERGREANDDSAAAQPADQDRGDAGADGETRDDAALAPPSESAVLEAPSEDGATDAAALTADSATACDGTEEAPAVETESGAPTESG